MSSDHKLPPISSLLSETIPPQGQYARSTYDITPSAPRSQHSFPEAQSLAPGPRSSFPSPPHGDYSSESAVSSTSWDGRSNRASPPSSTMMSARASPMLPPLPGTTGSRAVTPLEHGRDQRYMYTNGDSAYSQGSSGSSSLRPPQYSTGYDGRSQPQDYMGQYVGRPQGYSSQGGSSPGYPLSIEQVGGEYGDGKQKRRRGNLPKPVTDILRNWFQEHVAHPYPTEDEKQSLMAATGLSLSQISNWFINARRRSLPQITKQAQTESDIRDGSMPLNHN